MTSLFPAGFLQESFAGLPFPSYETCFTPWDCPEPELPASQSPKPAISDTSKESDQNHVNSSARDSNDQKTGTTASIMDKRKQRRMMSNRESARRSRMRKQNHLENLRNQVNRLRIENRQLTNKLRSVLYHCYRVRTDNDRLMSERIVLQQKLAYVGQVMLLRQ